MPGQYVNYRFTRPIMSLVRCFWTGLYLWVMIHAASLALVTDQRWSQGFFWNTRLPDKLIYFDALSQVPGGEYAILFVIFAVLGSIYLSSGCSLVGSQGHEPYGGTRPRLDKIGICSPYMGAFLGCWIFSTYVTARQLFMGRPDGTSTDLCSQIVIALLFKIMVMAHMCSVCLRAYVRLVSLVMDWKRGQACNLNFGEHLSLLFRN